MRFLRGAFFAARENSPREVGHSRVERPKPPVCAGRPFPASVLISLGESRANDPDERRPMMRRVRSNLARHSRLGRIAAALSPLPRSPVIVTGGRCLPDSINGGTCTKTTGRVHPCCDAADRTKRALSAALPRYTSVRFGETVGECKKNPKSSRSSANKRERWVISTGIRKNLFERYRDEVSRPS